ncbi:hypothetical protein [Cetobacterium sp.]|uniref:hypothetical protein n=1 Tax=Cetobacterium sp. TaxID=2071632 RepID=UPI003F67E469
MYSREFNISINPTKIELDLNKDSITDIHLINNGEKTIKLIPYFETPLEFQNKGLDSMLQCYPKFITLEAKEIKVIKLSFQKNNNKIFEKDELYKSYIIFKELPNNSKEILENSIVIVNEVGISITGRN